MWHSGLTSRVNLQICFWYQKLLQNLQITKLVPNEILLKMLTVQKGTLHDKQYKYSQDLEQT
jgi:hypothetical protein